MGLRGGEGQDSGWIRTVRMQQRSQRRKERLCCSGVSALQNLQWGVFERAWHNVQCWFASYQGTQ